MPAERWQDLGHMNLLGSLGEVLWGSWAEDGLFNLIKKQQCFGMPCGEFHLWGAQEQGPGPTDQ